MAIESVCLLLPGRAKIVFARLYWALFTRLIGIKVQIIGGAAMPASGRPVIYVSNHSSWLDIPVVGGVLEGRFVAKADIAGWPVIRTIARLGRTVFVSRSLVNAGKELDAMRSVLKGGDNLILFPEGTSSDGSRVLPFYTSFFALAAQAAEQRKPAQAAEQKRPAQAAGQNLSLLPLIQPVSVVYDRLGGLPVGRFCRPVFAWYGDMDIASHFGRLGRRSGLRATVLLHAPVDPADFASRKLLSQAVWRIVAGGASALRQNRPVQPSGTAPVAPDPSPALPAGAAFAPPTV